MHDHICQLLSVTTYGVFQTQVCTIHCLFWAGGLAHLSRKGLNKCDMNLFFYFGCSQKYENVAEI